MPKKTGPKDTQSTQPEQVQQVRISDIHPFKNHPFKVVDDALIHETGPTPPRERRDRMTTLLYFEFPSDGPFGPDADVVAIGVRIAVLAVRDLIRVDPGRRVAAARRG